jgi:hypothetical protein
MSQIKELIYSTPARTGPLYEAGERILLDLDKDKCLLQIHCSFDKEK